MSQDKIPHVVVTGMHRSGTSFLIRSLNLCGCYLGPESDFYDTEIAPKFGNPKGHWENMQFVNLNEQILKENNTTWDTISSEITKKPKNLQSSTEKILDSFHKKNAIGYGFKDPRFSVTLGFLAEYIPNLVLLGIFRHPLKVAESLKIRNGLTYQESLSLWKFYNENLLKLLQQHNGFLIDFDWEQKKLLDETSKIIKKLGLVETNLENWFSSTEKHSDKSMNSSYVLSSDIKNLYEQLKEYSIKNNFREISIPIFSEDEYRKIISDSITSSNSIYDMTIKSAKTEIKKIQNDVSLLDTNDPIISLLIIYFSREDLQKSFPELRENGDLNNFIKWANQICQGKIKGEIETREKILRFSDWYFKANNYLINREKISDNFDRDRRNLREEISKQKNIIADFDQDRTNLREEIKKQKNIIADFDQDRINLRKEVSNQKLDLQNLENAKKILVKEKDKITKEKTTLSEENTQLSKEKTKLSEENTQLSKEKTKLSEENTQLSKEKTTLSEENTRLDKEIVEKEKILKEFDQDRNNLRIELESNQSELEAIKSSKIFKIARFAGSKLDKVSKKKQKALGVTPIIKTSVEIIKTEGVNSFVTKASDKIKRKEFSILSPELYQPIPVNTKTKKLIHEDLDIKVIYEPQFSISVIIPTNSTEEKLQPLLENIFSQKGVSDLEIIIINSSNENLENLSSDTVKIVNIPSSQFNHGSSRTLGAEKANNDYLTFFTDDAIPINDHLLYDMCKIISKDPKIAAATVRQIPQSNCDLMYSYSLDYFYNFLGLDDDRIVYCDNLEELDKDEKRRICQIDDVCSCFKKNIFDQFKYKSIPYAEDLDIGVRLIEKGYKIAQLFSNGVIHSHNREASYYVKRQFIESQVLSPILGYPTVNFKNIGISSIENLISNFYMLYRSISKSLDLTNEKSSVKFFKNFTENLHSQNSQEPKSHDSSLDDLFNQFGILKNNNEVKFGVNQFIAAIEPFEKFLRKTYHENYLIKNDVSSTLYKIFGSVLGNSLGAYIYNARQNNKDKNEFLKIEKILGGI